MASCEEISFPCDVNNQNRNCIILCIYNCKYKILEMLVCVKIDDILQHKKCKH